MLLILIWNTVWFQNTGCDFQRCWKSEATGYSPFSYKEFLRKTSPPQPTCNSMVLDSGVCSDIKSQP